MFSPIWWTELVDDSVVSWSCMAPRATCSTALPISRIDDAVSWMAAEQVTAGTGPWTFEPERPVRRGEFATFLHRLAGGPPAPPHPFVDVVEAYQHDAVSWMAATGITTGTSASTFSPARVVTRADLAVFLHRYRGEPVPDWVVIEPTDAVCRRPLVVHATGDVNFDPGSAAIRVYDFEQKKIREPVRADCERFSLLTDRLDHMALQSTCVVPADVPKERADRQRLCLALKNGRKAVITGTFHETSFDPMYEMLLCVRGSAEAREGFAAFLDKRPANWVPE